MSSVTLPFRLSRFLSKTVHAIGEKIMYFKLAALAGLGLSLVQVAQLPTLVALPCVLAVYTVTGGWRFLWVVANTLARDGRALFFLLKLRFAMKMYLRKNENVPSLFKKTLARHPNREVFLYEKMRWTFQDVEEYSNAIANYFYKAGFRHGDVVAFFMESRPQYICFWLGLSKIGVIAALINFNLRNKSLLHCISVANPRAIIFGGELAAAIKEVQSELPQDIPLFSSGTLSHNDLLTATSLDQLLEKSSTRPPPAVLVKFKDKLMYIYTSGTTGLPKGAVITHSRFFYMARGMAMFLGITAEDVIYDTLPLYHSAGGILGVGMGLLVGSRLVIRKKFSASRFWDDCSTYGCTVAQYIGEICRYLLVQPEREVEKQHKVRLMFGNGLRPQLWKEFQRRFRVAKIGEFYGATEGNCNLVNMTGKVGAVGFMTRLIPSLYPVSLIRVNEETGEPLRDRNGLCIHAQPGEPGQLVGKIVKGDPAREFDGYVKTNDSSKKVVANVFKSGDLAFLTGDVLEMDEFGYMYFKDRTGDTFRWKGENVSTSELEDIVSNIVKLKDVVVYGIEVPGIEGRAGMAAIVDENESLDLTHLSQSLVRALPGYARPVFIRLLKTVDKTGTFKLKKNDLKKNGFNPRTTTDKLFYMDPKSGYKLIDEDIYDSICRGRIKL